MANWLGDARFEGVPLFVSRRRLEDRRTFPRAVMPWALDSGGFTELSLFGGWSVEPRAYAATVRRLRDEIGGLAWAAPQDWMCEPQVLAQTGLTVDQHLALTVANLLDLRSIDPTLPIVPVVQGYTEDDYLRCVELYDRAGIDLAAEPVVGVGTICRRQATAEAERILRRLGGLGIRVHAFGAKVVGLHRYHDAVESSDSLAWSYNARRNPPLAGCRHRSCANCATWALRWRQRLLANLGRPRQLALF